MTTLETRLLDTLRCRGPQTDRAITGIGLDSIEARKALEHLLALGLVTFTRRPGERKHRWRVEQRHAVPEVFADALANANSLKRQLANRFDLIDLRLGTLEDAEDTANILAKLEGSPSERREALRTLQDAHAMCEATLDAHRRPS